MVDKFTGLVTERKKGGVRILPARDQTGESHGRPRGETLAAAAGEAPPAKPDYAGKKPFEKKFEGKKPFGDRKFGDKKPFGGKKKFGGKPFKGKPKKPSA